ncbi:hypothetical protein BHM03_00052071 [Ensete ventricosum]|nr:hypothetical protein BHM03_00052071 [Ensete ventricosum]
MPPQDQTPVKDVDLDPISRRPLCCQPRRDGADKQVSKLSSAADEVRKVPLLVGADAIVMVHKEDGLVQKNTSVEELRKPIGSNRGRESRRIRSLQLRRRRETLGIYSFAAELSTDK